MIDRSIDRWDHNIYIYIYIYVVKGTLQVKLPTRQMKQQRWVEAEKRKSQKKKSEEEVRAEKESEEEEEVREEKESEERSMCANR